MRRFSIRDLFLATALFALHFAAFPDEALTGGSEWARILYLTPTVVTCLLHLRFRLKITHAMVVHYLTTVVWTFWHAVGVNLAINALNRANPRPGRAYQLLVYSNAWNDTMEMLTWGIVLAATYGLVGYTAVTASRGDALRPTSLGFGESGQSSNPARSSSRTF